MYFNDRNKKKYPTFNSFNHFIVGSILFNTFLNLNENKFIYFSLVNKNYINYEIFAPYNIPNTIKVYLY